MRRLPVRVLLLGCAGLLLGMQGVSNPTRVGKQTLSARQTAGGRKIAAPAAEAPFRLPADAAGVLLGKVLPPTARPGVLQNPLRSPPPSVPLPRFSMPSLPLPLAPLDPPRLPDVVKTTPVRPQLVQEEGLEDSFFDPEVPRKPSLAAGKRIRVPSADVALPPPLPVLARPTIDRVPLEDATMAASTRAVLSAPLPQRDKPAPYQRMTIPEPYEHHRPLTMKLPEERMEPVAAAPRPPRP